LLSTMIAVFLTSPVSLHAADETYASHPPMRPLPQATKRPLAEGPARVVDPAKGDDAADGSRQKPFKTLGHALRQLTPGDTLYLRGGTYYEHVFVTQSGTEDAPITIRAYPGELAVLDGGLREFLESPQTAWEPYKGGAEGEYISTKTYFEADDVGQGERTTAGAG
jgi:hypothetical protein